MPGMTHVGSSRSRRLPDCLSTYSTDSDMAHASSGKQPAVAVAKPQVAATSACSVVDDRNRPPRLKQETGESMAVRPQLQYFAHLRKVTRVALPIRQEMTHHCTQAKHIVVRYNPPWQGGACCARRQRAPQPSSAGLLL